MASPRVFVSSTCYDLSEVRDSLDSFIRKYHFEPVLSDKSDVYYSPDNHTYDDCLKEVQTCQLFILIIGGRYGGGYKKGVEKPKEKSKSITNYEYNIAKEHNIPIFTFVKRNVLENQHLYKETKRQNELKNIINNDIYYPAIDNQDTAIDIFDFIDEVSGSYKNNGFFKFDYSREIQDILSKQWAGMIYDFLIERQKGKEIIATNLLIQNLKLATEKSAELIKMIVNKEYGDDAYAVIKTIDNETEAKDFFQSIFNYFKLSIDYITLIVGNLVKNKTKFESTTNWYQYLLTTIYFKIEESSTLKGLSVSIIRTNIETLKSNSCIIVDGNLGKIDRKIFETFEKKFNSFKLLDEESRTKVLESFL